MNCDYVRSIFEYDQETGLLSWKSRPIDHFKSKRGCSIWNARYAGVDVTNVGKNGYVRVSIDYTRYLAHRIIWLYVYGELPECHIDHMDGNRLNNKIENLRLATSRDNARNMGLKSTNQSGVSGVCWCKRTGRWQAAITVDYKTIFLGRFGDLNDAREARKVAEEKYGFHKNHGSKR